jgi:hypothetical protein
MKLLLLLCVGEVKMEIELNQNKFANGKLIFPSLLSPVFHSATSKGHFHCASDIK